MMSAYKDLTDALPSKIGRPNKFGIPPAYFDADSERWSHSLRQPAKVDSPMQRTNHHEDAETVFG